MSLDRSSSIDSAIRDAVARIAEQRKLIAAFEAKGYETGAPRTLLSCLLDNLRTLERRRREQVVEVDDLVVLP